MGRSSLRLSGRDEEDDPDHGQCGSRHLAPADALMGQQHAEGEREDQAQRSEGLDHDERTAVECRRLHDPAAGLQERAGQPDGAMQNLQEESRVVARRRGGESAPLLQHRAESKEHGREDGERLTHGTPG